MIRLFFTTAFLLGATAIGWMGSTFWGANTLALTVTVIIGCVYSIGAMELLQFRRATRTLSQALVQTIETPSPVTILEEWLNQIDPSLRNAVRSRIEGNRVGLPAPVLTPYLVGLLVMLGLLGTFVGMGVTLKGAVSALEGSTQIEAIRAGLAAPIKGLSLAFGTSVAGVAASAMLGLMSTLSRRDRMLATRRLDTQTATAFRDFSLVHGQRETFQALQAQARALPEVAGLLKTMSESLTRLGDRLSDQLMANQTAFHTSTQANYLELAESIDRTLKEGLSVGIRQAGELIQPVVNQTLAGVTEMTQNVHRELTRTVREELSELGDRFAHTSQDVSRAWQTGIESHHQANDALIGRMQATVTKLGQQYTEMATSMLETLDQTSRAWLERHASGEQERLDTWMSAFNQTHREWSSQQKQIVAAFQETASALTNSTQMTAEGLTDKMGGLLQSTEDLIEARMQSETTWLAGHHERMTHLTETIKSELVSLRADETVRGEAALKRLSLLDEKFAAHLATLHQEIEAPLEQLMRTASEAPRAAVEVIGQLREEVSKGIERDNALLEERHRIIKELDELANALGQNAHAQREAIEELVGGTQHLLQDLAGQVTSQVGSEVANLSNITDHFSCSAAEMASLGEAFGTAVELFNNANHNLIENLTRIEESLNQVHSRSDEQLGYYVAQAREIIDHSMLSQKEIFEELRLLRKNGNNHHGGAEWKN